MRNLCKGIKLFFLVFCIICFSLNGFGQSVGDVIKKAKLSIYENPDGVIQLCDSIYKNPNTSDGTRVEALITISDAYSSKRDYKRSLKYFQKANELAKGNPDIDLQIFILNRTAARYQQIKAFDKAIEYLDKCDKLIAEHPNKTSGTYFTQATNNILRGFIYKDRLNCDIAINYFDNSIKQYNTFASEKRSAHLSIVYYNKGNCYVSMGQYDKAEYSFQEAIKMAKVINAKSLEAFAMKGLGEVFYYRKQYDKAINVLNDAIMISKAT